MHLESIRGIIAEQQPVFFVLGLTLIIALMCLIYFLVRGNKSSTTSRTKSGDDSWLDDDSSSKKGKKVEAARKTKQKKGKSSMIGSGSTIEISKPAASSVIKIKPTDSSENKKTVQQEQTSKSKKKQALGNGEGAKQDGPLNVSGDWTVAVSKKKPKSKKSKAERDAVKDNFKDTLKDEKSQDIDTDLTEGDKVDDVTNVEQYDMTISGLVAAVEDYMEDEEEKELGAISKNAAFVPDEEEEEEVNRCVEDKNCGNVAVVNGATGSEEDVEREELKEEDVTTERIVAELQTTASAKSKEKKKNKKKSKEKATQPSAGIDQDSNKPSELIGECLFVQAKTDKVLPATKPSAAEVDNAHLKRMRVVEEVEIPSFQSRLVRVKDQLDRLEKEISGTGVRKEDVKAVRLMLSTCTESMMKELEQLDALSLSKSSADVQNKRKDIIRGIQALLSAADALDIRITAAAVHTVCDSGDSVKTAMQDSRAAEGINKELNHAVTELGDTRVVMSTVNPQPVVQQPGVAFDEIGVFSKSEPENTKKKKVPTATLR